MSEAEKFLRDKSLSFYAENPKYYKGLVLKFEDVIEVMEQYHQKQVKLGLTFVSEPFVCRGCGSTNYKILTRSTSQCKDCGYAQAN